MLVTVTDLVALVAPTVTAPNASSDGAACSAAGAAAAPVPDSETGMLAPPPVIVYVALSVVADVGVYVKVTVQLAPAPRLVPPQVPPLVNLAGAAG